MGNLLIHPLVIAVIGGGIAIGIALYNNYQARNLAKMQMRVEAQVKANGVIAGKVDQTVCEGNVEEMKKRFDKGEEQFRKIERALVAIYVKQGGTPQELDL